MPTGPLKGEPLPDEPVTDKRCQHRRNQEPGPDTDDDSASPAFDAGAARPDQLQRRFSSHGNAYRCNKEQHHEHHGGYRERDHSCSDTANEQALCGQTGQQRTSSAETSYEIAEPVEHVM